ncbi:MAG: hypothetical protein HY293_13115 [Planctomycetes bacterium]|nr:hypothetical protein [Planctomycetota bacterium]
MPPAPGPAGAVFYRAANLNGPATVIDGRRWDGKAAKDLAFSTDGAFENQNVVLNPPTDDARAAMIRSSAFSSAGTAAKFYGVPPGTYLVYAYFWEDNNPEIYDIFVQGKEVLKGYNSGPAGHWDKLGPYPAVVTEGVLEVHTSGGHANFSGLEVWKSTK